MNILKKTLFGILALFCINAQAQVNISAAQRLLTIQRALYVAFFEKEGVFVEKNEKAVYDTARLMLYNNLFQEIRILILGALSVNVSNEQLSNKIFMLFEALEELKLADNNVVIKFISRIEEELRTLAQKLLEIQEQTPEEEYQAILQESSGDSGGSEKERGEGISAEEFARQLEEQREKPEGQGSWWDYVPYFGGTSNE